MSRPLEPLDTATQASPRQAEPMIRSPRVAEGVAAGAIVLFGAWVLWQAMQLREGPGYAAVGPRTFPLIVGVGLLVSGLALLWGSVHGRPVEPGAGSEAAAPTDWRTLLTMAALLLGYVFLFQPLGFVLTSALFLIGGAWALGSRAPIRDVVCGVALSLATFFVFTRLLGLELPAGPLEAPLRALRAMLLPPL